MKGIPASGGIAIGKAFVYSKDPVRVFPETIAPEDVPAQQAALDAAVEKSREQLLAIKSKAGQALPEKEAAIFEAHLMFLDDPEYTGIAREKIGMELVPAAYAVKAVTDGFVEEFRAIEDEYFRERAADIADVGERIVRNILGAAEADLSLIDAGSVVIARDLAPSDTAQLDRTKVAGFVTEVGGKTSHTAIMARSLEIPAVLGLTDATQEIRSGETVIVDGDEGTVIAAPEEAEIEAYAKKRKAHEAEREELRLLTGARSVTADGHRVRLFANIGLPADAEHAEKHGAEGIGLYRTEFLFMDTDAMPDEESQFAAYRRVLETMRGRPVVIRTLDIGGDKELPYLKMEHEENPFLGVRALRLCLKEPALFRTQLRAILRAGAHGDARIMFPMVSGVDEVRQAKAVLEDCKRELAGEGAAFDPEIKVGIMVEIPSAALTAEAIAKEVDFFSIGTNDLCQYTLAVDRMNAGVGYLYDHFHPAVLRLIKLVIDAAREAGVHAGMCGEMAGDEKAAALLLGLGLEEFSMAAASLSRVKRAVRATDLSKARRLADEALGLESAGAVRALLEAAGGTGSRG